MLIILQYDGWNVGFSDDFGRTFLEFDDCGYALKVLKHYRKWIGEE